MKATVDIELWKSITNSLHRSLLIDHRRSLYNDLWLWGVDRILLSRHLLGEALLNRWIARLLRLAKGSVCDGTYD